MTIIGIWKTISTAERSACGFITQGNPDDRRAESMLSCFSFSVFSFAHACLVRVNPGPSFDKRKHMIPRVAARMSENSCSSLLLLFSGPFFWHCQNTGTGPHAKPHEVAKEVRCRLFLGIMIRALNPLVHPSPPGLLMNHNCTTMAQ